FVETTRRSESRRTRAFQFPIRKSKSRRAVRRARERQVAGVPKRRYFVGQVGQIRTRKLRNPPRKQQSTRARASVRNLRLACGEMTICYCVTRPLAPPRAQRNS